MKGYLFHDFDVRFLFDPALDGIEDPDHPAYQAEGNLHPCDWFKTFERQPALSLPARGGTTGTDELLGGVRRRR